MEVQLSPLPVLFPGAALDTSWVLRGSHRPGIDCVQSTLLALTNFLLPVTREVGTGKRSTWVLTGRLSAALDFSLLCSKKLLGPVQSLSSG